jgi:hypothetical protein
MGVTTDLLCAIRDVAAGRCQRICAPGKWRVWREGEQVKFEVLV